MKKRTTSICRTENGVEHGRRVRREKVYIIKDLATHLNPVGYITRRDEVARIEGDNPTVTRLENFDTPGKVIPWNDGDYITERKWIHLPSVPYTDYTIVPGRGNRHGWQGKPITIRVRELCRSADLTKPARRYRVIRDVNNILNAQRDLIQLQSGPSFSRTIVE